MVSFRTQTRRPRCRRSSSAPDACCSYAGIGIPAKEGGILPGGFLDEGEDPVAGLRRELFEETGLEIEPVEYLGVFVEPYFNRYVLGLTWLVSAVGDARPADDVAELQWFAADGLPAADEFQFAHHPRLLAAWAEQVGPPEPQVEPIGP